MYPSGSYKCYPLVDHINVDNFKTHMFCACDPMKTVILNRCYHRDLYLPTVEDCSIFIYSGDALSRNICSPKRAQYLVRKMSW